MKCYFTPDRLDYGLTVSCKVTNPVSGKSYVGDFVLDQLRYSVEAHCKQTSDKYGVPQVWINPLSCLITPLSSMTCHFFFCFALFVSCSISIMSSFCVVVLLSGCSSGSFLF